MERDNNSVNNINRLLSNKELAKLVMLIFPKYITKIDLRKDADYSMVTIESKYLLSIAYLLKYSSLFRFQSLMDVFAVDYPSKIKRFQLQYYLLSHFYAQRLYFAFNVSDNEPVESLSVHYPSADWLEREVWDMFGVFFLNHPNLRRILTDYGFKGFPLRKDFPLTGYLEVRYSEKKKRVVLKPLQIAQEFRLFDFTSPWERFGSSSK